MSASASADVGQCILVVSGALSFVLFVDAVSSTGDVGRVDSLLLEVHSFCGDEAMADSESFTISSYTPPSALRDA